MNNTKYVHGIHNHNLDVARELSDIFLDLFQPNSVVDVGCGVGNFLYCFKEKGINNILGLDGKWLDFEKLYIDDSHVKIVDFENIVKLDQKFDIALCLEVAEHISLASSDQFLDFLTETSDIIIFSAAIPGQGGQNHVNEQWQMWWKNKFKMRGYSCYDMIRPLIWENSNIKFWYKQNIMVYARDGLQIKYNKAAAIPDLVHPDLFERRNNELEKICSGNSTFRFYIKVLLKKITNSFR